MRARDRLLLAVLVILVIVLRRRVHILVFELGGVVRDARLFRGLSADGVTPLHPG